MASSTFVFLLFMIRFSSISYQASAYQLEIGYRISLKCVESEDPSNEQNTQTKRIALEISNKSVKPHVMLDDAEKLIASIKHRSLLDDSSTLEDKSQVYITYRSCIPAFNEENLSVLGFEEWEQGEFRLTLDPSSDSYDQVCSFM